MTVSQPVVKCGDCGQFLPENASTPIENRKPCPRCGSAKRAVSVDIQATVSLQSKLGLKARHAKSGRPFMEQMVGDDLQRKTGKWMRIRRVIDRVNNWYREIIHDPTTGKIVHQTEEPLTEHKGHGDAKKSKGD
jgi:hypothetical protein